MWAAVYHPPLAEASPAVATAIPASLPIAAAPAQVPSPPAAVISTASPVGVFGQPVFRFFAACVLLALITFAINIGGIRDRFKRAIHPPAPQPVPAVAAIRLRPSVAVLGFKNISGRPDEAWLSTAFVEMLSTELGSGGEIRIVPEEEISRAKADLELREADSLSKETLARIRRILGSDRVVVGSYTALGNNAGAQVRLDLRVQDAVNGETIALLSATGTEARLFQIVSQAGAQARGKLGVSPLSPENTATLLGALPQNPEAARLYSEGLIAPSSI